MLTQRPAAAVAVIAVEEVYGGAARTKNSCAFSAMRTLAEVEHIQGDLAASRCGRGRSRRVHRRAADEGGAQGPAANSCSAAAAARAPKGRGRCAADLLAISPWPLHLAQWARRRRGLTAGRPRGCYHC